MSPLPPYGPVWIHDAGRSRWLRFAEPEAVLRADSLSAVPGVIAAAEAAAAHGRWAVGWLAYEAAPAFEPALATHPPAPGLPLAWFGLFREPHIAMTLPPGVPQRLATEPDLGEAAFVKKIGQIQAAIARGDTYQVNLTFRLNSPAPADPWLIFSQLQGTQPGGYGAYFDIGSHVVASASPELFWRLEGKTITMRPMKGTRRRGRWPAEDAALAAELVASEKDRAENVMILDMARNDLGRVARIGSVRVPQLFTAERYPTLWQMTSTVEAETTAGLSEIMWACFPCASITGAPKASTMRLIRALEDTPRGVYTGAIGFWAPGRQAQFSVGIRTAVVDRAAERLTYGIGSGIVWDSSAVDEYQECLLKARTLTELAEPFGLIETLRWTPAEGFWLEDMHLERLALSAQRFGFRCDLETVRAALRVAVRDAADARRVRLVLMPAGEAQVTAEAAPPVAWAAPVAGRAPVCLRLAPTAVDSREPWLYHKTTRREVYERALAAARALGPCDDVVLWNAQGEITETSIGNLVVDDGQRLVTPPMTSGLLAGTFRRWLLERGAVEEGVITRALLARARAVWRVNAVRGWEVACLEGM